MRKVDWIMILIVIITLLFVICASKDANAYTYRLLPGDSTGGRYVKLYDSVTCYFEIDSLKQVRRQRFTSMNILFEQVGGVPDSVKVYWLNAYKDGAMGYDTKLHGLTVHNVMPESMAYNSYLYGLTRNWSILKELPQNLDKLYMNVLSNDSVGQINISVYPEYNKSK